MILSLQRNFSWNFHFLFLFFKQTGKCQFISFTTITVILFDSISLCRIKTYNYRLSLSMGFSRQEYWSGLPCPPPGDLPNPGIEPRSPALQVDSLQSEPPGKYIIYFKNKNLLDLGKTGENMYCIFHVIHTFFIYNIKFPLVTYLR